MQYFISIAYNYNTITSIKYTYNKYAYLILDEYIFKCYHTYINNKYTYKYIN